MKEKMKPTTSASTSRNKRWFTPYQSKENLRPAVQDNKQGPRAQKRNVVDVQSPRSSRRSSNPKSKKLTLIQEFDEIVRSARSTAASPRRASKSLSVLKVRSPPPKPESAELFKQLRISQEEIKSPERPRSSKCSVAPSPATPPLPKELPLMMEKEDDAPSPRGMNLSNTDNSESFHFVTQSEFLKQEESNNEEPMFLDAVDSSLNASGLDLDNLIDEIFTKNSMLTDQTDDKQDHLIPHPSGKSLDTPFDSDSRTLSDEKKENGLGKGSEDNHVTQSERSTDIPSQCTKTAEEDKCEISHYDRCESNAQVNPLVIKKPLNAPNRVKELTSEQIIEETGCIANKEMKNQQKQSPSAILHEIEKSEKDFCCSPSIEQAPNEGVKETSTNSQNAISDNIQLDSLNETCSLTLGNDEAFCEDLSLSHSQFLDIDAKCGLLEDIAANQSMEPVLTNTPATASFQEPSNNLGFIVPHAPRMEWVQKSVEGRRRLQMVTQEISRLNAMVLRARRMMWPRQDSTLVQQQIRSNPSVQQTPQFHQLPSEQLHLSAALQDPEWN